MTQLTYRLASVHDHWLEQRSSQHAIPLFKLWLRHFARRHIHLVDGLEWLACGLIAIATLILELIVNA